MKRKGEKTLRAVHPNIGIEMSYRRKIDRLLRGMTRSYLWYLRAQYRETPPRMAQDATPAAELKKELSKLGSRWQKKWDEAADKIAAHFAKEASKRSDAALRKILRDAGISVRFKMTAAMRDILDATVAENVALIKSIPEQYHTQVQSLVMRSVTAGRDLEQLTKDLLKRYPISRRRAALIARDQNNKATASLQRARQQELGIKEAIWLHSGGGKEPRPSHVKKSGKRFSLETGWYDPDEREWIFPGQLINCRCVSKPVIKGFS